MADDITMCPEAYQVTARTAAALTDALIARQHHNAVPDSPTAGTYHPHQELVDAALAHLHAGLHQERCPGLNHRPTTDHYWPWPKHGFPSLPTRAQYIQAIALLLAHVEHLDA